jgi:ferredoxin
MHQRAVDPALSVDVCGSCGGVWFDWFDGEAAGLSKLVDAGRAGDGLDDNRTHRAVGPCPRDGSPLAEHPYLDAGPPVLRCATCMGLFAPRATIRSLQQFHERMPTRGAEPIERAGFFARLWHAFFG